MELWKMDPVSVGQVSNVGLRIVCRPTQGSTQLENIIIKICLKNGDNFPDSLVQIMFVYFEMTVYSKFQTAHTIQHVFLHKVSKK